ncbi:MAG: hypothetical protein K2X86_06330 [Cytophagaceae bacterium]|nr:hypothetical protein [Cytophagaceae bacterium]
MDDIKINRLIIRLSAFIFLLLGFAVVFVEYWFRYRNRVSEGLAVMLFTLCTFIFIIIIFFYLNNKYDFLGIKEKEKKK